MSPGAEIAPDLAGLAVPIDQLDGLEGNPRRGDVEAVTRSYARFGQRKPIVARRKADGRGEVTAGNTQFAAAQALGWTEIAVVWVDDDDDTARAWALADNRTSDLGLYDQAALAAYLEQVRIVGDDELLAATGYTVADVGEILARARRRGVDADEIPEPPDQSIATTGDVWRLGGSTLVVGDSTSPDAVAAALGGDEPYLMVTDPPYGVELDPRWRNGVLNKLGPAAHHPYMTEGHGNRTLSQDVRADWSEAFELVPSLRIAYVWHSGIHAAEVVTGLERIGFHLVSQLIWDKEQFAIGRGLYHWEHEPCWVARRGAAVPFLGQKNQGTIWRARSPKMIFGTSDEEKWDHPAQKPLSVIEPPILNHLEAGGLVFDPFLGSGTTLIAAEVNGRHCAGIEIEPRFADVICRRFQLVCGELPIHDRSGEKVDFDA